MTYPTVRLKALVPDRCNYKDKTFESYVHKWMARMMPSIPMGMLDTESELAFERWQIEADSIHDVEQVHWTVWTCDECGEVFDEEQEDACCEVEDCDESCAEHDPSCDGFCDHLGHRNQCLPGLSDLEQLAHAEKWVVPFTKEDRTAYVVMNENTSEALNDGNSYVRHESLSEDYDDVPVEGWQGKTYGAYGWDDEGEAYEAAETADNAYHSEHGHESSYGFPWANNTVFIPDNWISDASLKAAGFRVATYVGGKGDPREDQEFRLAGIDGGGYSFSGAHFAPLVAHHHEERKSTVETDNGDAYITTDDRPDLVKLAEDGQKEAS
jgi:hypothetical protein